MTSKPDFFSVARSLDKVGGSQEMYMICDAAILTSFAEIASAPDLGGSIITRSKISPAPAVSSTPTAESLLKYLALVIPLDRALNSAKETDLSKVSNPTILFEVFARGSEKFPFPQKRSRIDRGAVTEQKSMIEFIIARF